MGNYFNLIITVEYKYKKINLLFVYTIYITFGPIINDEPLIYEKVC